VLRLGFAGVLLGTSLVEHNGWHFGSDDQVTFYAFSHVLVQGEITPVPTTLGYSLLLAPVAFFTDFVLQAIPPVAIVQILLTIPATLLLYRAGTRLMDRRSAAVGTTLWLVSPLLLGPLFLPGYVERFRYASTWVGLDIHVDYASALCVVAALALASGARTDGSLARGFLIGLVAGFAFLVKPSNVVVLAAALVALAAWRRWRTALVALAAATAVFAPQLVYNYHLYGTVTRFAYYEEFASRWDLVSLAYIPRVYGKLVLGNYTGPLLLVGVALALFVTWRRFPAARWLIVAQTVGFALFFGVLFYAISSTLLRYATAALPLVCLAAGGALAGRPAEAVQIARSPGRLALGLGVAAVAAALALAAWIPMAPPGNGFPTLEGMRPRAEVRGSTVFLRWNEPSAPARLTYQVERSRGNPSLPESRKDRLIGVSRGTEAVDRPGPGAWWYQIKVTPGPSPDGWPPGIGLAESPPLRVVVRDPTRLPPE
jgi:hypothetical protein